ncbi:MAG: DUF5412 family protein [Sarcina sp.]
MPQLFPITEDLILSIDSPDNKYKLNLYFNSGNASVDFSTKTNKDSPSSKPLGVGGGGIVRKL